MRQGQLAWAVWAEHTLTPLMPMSGHPLTGTSSGSVGEMAKVQASRRLRGRCRSICARVTTSSCLA